ncbi:Tvp38p PWA37_004720 [Arxiozyma heterogenica]|uniref:Tvp38p n=1 Tax=Arxiozyma heterogenica TaxID=278026 RepID=UPI002EEE79D8
MSTVGVYENVPGEGDETNDGMDNFSESIFNEINDDLEMSLENDNPDFLDIYHLTPRQRLIYTVKKVLYHLSNQFFKLPLWQRIIATVATVLFLILGIMFLIFHKTILNSLVETSNNLREKTSTQFILGLLIFTVAFPPLIGFSFLSTSTGLIYGVSLHGWLLLSISSVTGCIASFYVFQNILKSRAQRLVHLNKRFEAFASILQENNSYLILALFRLCPFPYSLTNGAIAGVYGVSLKNFAIANLITTPKMFIYLFIGSRIKNLGETKSTGEKMLDLFSILFTLTVLFFTAWLLYFKTQNKYRELINKQNQEQQSMSSEIPDSVSFEL